MRNVVLDREHIRERTVICVRPDPIAICRIHELDCDPQRLVRPAHTAFQDMSDAERVTDILDGSVRASFEAEGRGAGRDAQAGDRGQPIQQFLG